MSVANTGGGGGGGASSSAASSEDDQDDLLIYENNNNNNANANNMLSRGSVPNNNSNITNVNNNNNNLYGVYRKYRKRPVWEVIEGYRDPSMKVVKPSNYEGILLKRRNWPMKGWHKRYFILADGILTYGKSKADMQNKNKIHGTVNTYLSIVSYITSSRRILIDFSTQSSAFVCHLKAKTQADFAAWLEHLKLHRLYYQFKYAQSSSSSNQLVELNKLSSNTQSIASNNSSSTANLLSSTSNPTSNQLTAGNSSQASTNLDTNNVNQTTNKPNRQTVLDDKMLGNQFKQIEDALINLSKLLSSIQGGNVPASVATTTATPARSYHQATPSSVSLDQSSPNVVNKIHLSKSNPNLINNEIQAANMNSGLLVPTSAAATNLTNPTLNLINSSNAIAGLVMASTGSSIVLNVPSSSINESKANLSSMQTSSATLTSTTGHLLPPINVSNNSDESSLKFIQEAKSINDQLNNLYQHLLLKRQSLLKAETESNTNNETTIQRSHRSQSVMSTLSLQDSQLQFYDAIEDFTSDSDSEENDENENDSDVNEGGSNHKSQIAIVPDYERNISYDPSEEELQALKMLSRRRELPAKCPDTSQVSLWGILRKAIGKDLSKIALPVILNEPLSILQRLSEELEYSDLLDIANSIQDPYDRMVYVAAFVISGYSSSYYRNGAKSFNPLLGETYELIRPDKGWKYVAEQVSHHPAISASYCHSKSFIHEQIFHAKIKFWGRSMEVHPEGFTRVTLPKFNETYQWNKIVMYIYNLTGSQRKIEHNGEIVIKCTNGVSCSITFPKSNYSSQKNEFYGDVIFENVVKRKIFGQWHESFLCGTDNTAKTIWRMGAMPEDCNLYYGFTRFAIELNELTDDIKEDIPPTDSRFRPDQRLLENGRTDQADLEKQRIEEAQRARRRELEIRGEAHKPLWFEPLKDNPKEWVFNNQYWSKRENPGYKNLKHIFPELW